MTVARLPVIVRRWDTLDYVPVSVAAAALLDEQPVYIAVTPIDSVADPDWKVATWEGAADSVREARILVGPLGVVEVDPDERYTVSVWIDDTATQIKLNAYELWPTRLGADSTESFSTPTVEITLPISESYVDGLVTDLAALRARDDLLQGEIDALPDPITLPIAQSDVSGLPGALSTLTTGLSTETTNRTTADTTLTTNLASEVTRATTAEGLKANKAGLPKNILDYGAAASGGAFDNRTAILAAITAAGTAGSVVIPAGVWGFTGEIQVPNGINFIGEGKKATTLLCLSADASIHFGPTTGAGARRGRCGWFGVDANDLATQPVLWGLGANASYYDILVQDSPGAGYKFVSSQNIQIFAMEVQSCLVGVWIDGGAKNLTFVGGTVNECDTGWKLASEIQHWSGDDVHHANPQAIAVYAVLTESESKPAAIGLLINAGKDTVWRDGAFNIGGSCIKVSLNDPRGASPSIRLLLLDGVKLSGAGTGNGIWVDNCPFEVTCIGETTFEGCTVQFRLDNAAARVHLNLFQGLAPAVTSRFASTLSGYTEGQMVTRQGEYRLRSATTYTCPDTTEFTPADFILRGAQAGSVWDFEGWFSYEGNTGAGFQIHPAVPADCAMQWGVQFYNAQASNVWTIRPDFDRTSIARCSTTTGAPSFVRVFGTATPTTGTDIAFEIRRGTSTGTDVKLRGPESYLKFIKRSP